MSARRELEDLREQLRDTVRAVSEYTDLDIYHYSPDGVAFADIRRAASTLVLKANAMEAGRDKLREQVKGLKAELDQANADLRAAREKLFTESMRKIDTYTNPFASVWSKPSRVQELEQENKDLRFLLASTKPREDTNMTVHMTREAVEKHHRHAADRDYRIRYDDVTGETTIRYAPKDQFVDPREKENTDE